MREIPDPGFAGDDGAADPGLAAALAAYDQDPERRYSPALAALQSARLLVPVVAEPGEGAPPGGRAAVPGADQPGEKTADMAAVLMRGRDGRLALLAFTCLASLHRWDAAARPVPVRGRQAAGAALADGAAALLVDVAGPVMFVVEESDLHSLSEGYTLARVGDGYGWVRPE